MDYQTIMAVQGVCDHFAHKLDRDRVILKIHSAHRCEGHNFQVGGALNSQHLQARAIDFSIRDVKPQQIYDFLILKYVNRYGMGLYKTFVHLDTRSGTVARWEG